MLGYAARPMSRFILFTQNTISRVFLKETVNRSKKAYYMGGKKKKKKP